MCRMLKAIKADTKRYNVSEEKLWQIEKMLFTLKGKLLDGRIFQVSEPFQIREGNKKYQINPNVTHVTSHT